MAGSLRTVKQTFQVDAIGPYSILAGGLFLGGAGYLALGPIPPFEPNLATVILGLAVTGFAGSIPWVRQYSYTIPTT